MLSFNVSEARASGRGDYLAARSLKPPARKNDRILVLSYTIQMILILEIFLFVH